jgi:hypothetical protein
LLRGRTEGSIEFKHQNISAVLIDLGFPYISGYQPLGNVQNLLRVVIGERLARSTLLLEAARASAEDPLVAVPEVENLLDCCVQERPKPRQRSPRIGERTATYAVQLPMNYLEREARNSALGRAGEEFIIAYERARLASAGKEGLAAKIEHTSVVRGDHEGYDILSFETSGEERLIEVKTTKYGSETPFFTSANEVSVSKSRKVHYVVYRLFEFKVKPRFFELQGAIDDTCELTPSTYLAVPW